eukprot:gene14134-biopygen23219
MSMPKRKEEATLCDALRVVLERDANLDIDAYLLCSETRQVCRRVCSSLRKDVEAYAQRLTLQFEGSNCSLIDVSDLGSCSSLLQVDLSYCASLMVLPKIGSRCNVINNQDEDANEDEEEDVGVDADEEEDVDADEEEDVNA